MHLFIYYSYIPPTRAQTRASRRLTEIKQIQHIKLKQPAHNTIKYNPNSPKLPTQLLPYGRHVDTTKISSTEKAPPSPAFEKTEMMEQGGPL